MAKRDAIVEDDGRNELAAVARRDEGSTCIVGNFDNPFKSPGRLR